MLQRVWIAAMFVAQGHAASGYEHEPLLRDYFPLGYMSTHRNVSRFTAAASLW